MFFRSNSDTFFKVWGAFLLLMTVLVLVVMGVVVYKFVTNGPPPIRIEVVPAASSVVK